MSEGTGKQNIPTPTTSQPPMLNLIARCGSSSAWRQFGFESSDIIKKTPICKLGRKSVAVKSSSPTNLFHHLRTSPRQEYNEYEKLCESTEHDLASAADFVKEEKKKHTQQTLAESIGKVPHGKKKVTDGKP